MTTRHFLLVALNLILLTLHPDNGIAKSHSENKTPDPDTETYRVWITEPDRARVEYTFTVTDSILTMSSRGAQNLEKRWGEFVGDLRAETAKGREIQISPINGWRWALNAQKGEQVTLSYEVLLKHEDYEWSGGIDGAAYQSSHGVFYTGRSLFIMNGASPGEIRVKFDLPDGWKASTVWDRSESDRESYRLKTYEDLTESMLFAGMHEELVLQRSQFELVFALGGEYMINKKEEYKRLAEGVLDYYIDLMGGVPRSGTGKDLQRILVIFNSSSMTDGEVIGNSISILEAEQADEMSQVISRFLFSHELFHLWNGKSFYPTDERCEWYKEGVSNYYTLKSLYQTGILGEESFFCMLNAFFYQKYSNDPGVGKMSITQGDQKHDHWGLIYCGGLFAGIAQDMVIRSQTDNEKSLDDLMRILFTEYGTEDKPYSLEDLTRHLSDLSGTDQSGFFEDYVTGPAEIPLDAFLEMSGLEAKVENKQLLISRNPNETAMQKKMIEGILGATSNQN